MYASPEARLGVRFVDRFELSLGFESMFLFAVTQPVVSGKKEVNLPGEGLASFGFGGQELTAGTLVVLVPSLALRVGL